MAATQALRPLTDAEINALDTRQALAEAYAQGTITRAQGVARVRALEAAERSALFGGPKVAAFSAKPIAKGQIFGKAETIAQAHMVECEGLGARPVRHTDAVWRAILDHAAEILAAME